MRGAIENRTRSSDLRAHSTKQTVVRKFFRVCDEGEGSFTEALGGREGRVVLTGHSIDPFNVS